MRASSGCRRWLRSLTLIFGIKDENHREPQKSKSRHTCQRLCRERHLNQGSPMSRFWLNGMLESGLPQNRGIPHLKTGNQTLWMLVCLARAPQDINSRRAVRVVGVTQ